MSDITLFSPQPPKAAEPTSLEKQVDNSIGSDFLSIFKLIHKTSPEFDAGTAKAGEYMCGNLNVGSKVKVLIGAWRFHALRMKDQSMDLNDFNMSINSKYDATNNTWINPDGFTPNFKAVMNKEVPDSKSPNVANLVGFDILLYLPEIKEFGVYFLNKTAKSMTNVCDTLKNNRGRLAQLSAHLHDGKSYSWQLPDIALLTDIFDEEISPELLSDVMDKFLNPGPKWNPTAQIGRDR